MIRVILFSLLTIGVWSTCPPPESLAPCKCILDSTVFRIIHRITCEGYDINEQSLSEIFTNVNISAHVELKLYNTSVTKLRKLDFGSNKLRFISLKYNAKLAEIDFDAFKLSANTATEFRASFNTKLTFNNLFDAIHTMSNLEQLELSGIELANEIPAHAFRPTIQNPKFGQKLLYINISYTNITSIGSYAFYDLPQLRLLNLPHNKINKIDSNGLELGKITFPGKYAYRWIDVSFNRITENSFGNNSIKNNGTIAHLYIGQNPIKYLPEKVFKPYVQPRVLELHAIASDFRSSLNLTCDCNMKWMLDLPVNYRSAYNNVYCGNFGNKLSKTTIFSLKVSDLGKCN